MTQWNSSDLAEPPALAKDTLRVVPLGGWERSAGT